MFSGWIKIKWYEYKKFSIYAKIEHGFTTQKLSFGTKRCNIGVCETSRNGEYI